MVPFRSTTTQTFGCIGSTILLIDTFALLAPSIPLNSLSKPRRYDWLALVAWTTVIVLNTVAVGGATTGPEHGAELLDPKSEPRQFIMTQHIRKFNNSMLPSTPQTSQIRPKKLVTFSNYSYDPDERSGSLLGVGSYGKVFKGYATTIVNGRQNREQVAIKKVDIRCDFQAFDQIMESLRSEIVALKSISNPHIIKLFDFVRMPEENSVYLVLQYCSQGNLEKFINRKQDQLTLLDIRYYFMQILEGFKTFHKRFNHRDVKPQNVLVNKENVDGKDTYVIKVSDFGLAKMKPNIQLNLRDSVSLTMAEYQGTRETLAPEVLKGAIDYNKSDIFSLGIILYWMCYGVYPRQQHLKAQQNEELQEEDIKYPSEGRVQVSPQIIQVMKSMLKFDPLERMTWQQLFDHKLFDKELLTIQFRKDMAKSLPKIRLAQNPSNVTVEDLLYDIEQKVTNRRSAYFRFGERRPVRESEAASRVRKALAIQQMKIMYLLMCLTWIQDYKPSERRDLEMKEEIRLFRDLVVIAIKKLIDNIYSRLAQEVGSYAPHYVILNKNDMSALNKQDAQLLQETCRCRRQDSLYRIQTIMKFPQSDLEERCIRADLKQQFNALFNQNQALAEQLQCAILQLVRRVQPQIPTEDTNQDPTSSKQSILLLHRLFMVRMIDDIFHKDTIDSIGSLDNFFKREREMGEEPHFFKLQKKIRRLLRLFSFPDESDLRKT